MKKISVSCREVTDSYKIQYKDGIRPSTRYDTTAVTVSNQNSLRELFERQEPKYDLKVCLRVLKEEKVLFVPEHHVMPGMSRYIIKYFIHKILHLSKIVNCQLSTESNSALSVEILVNNVTIKNVLFKGYIHTPNNKLYKKLHKIIGKKCVMMCKHEKVEVSYL